MLAGARKRAGVLCHPYVLSAPQRQARGENQERLPHPRLLLGLEEGRYAMSPVHSQGPQSQVRGQNSKWHRSGHFAYRQAFWAKLVIFFLCVSCVTTCIKRAGNRAAQPTLSSNPQPTPELPTQHVQDFKVLRSRKKKFTPCLWKGHAHRSIPMFQCVTLLVLHMHSCSFEVLRFGGATPPSPRRGGVMTLGGGGRYKVGVR